MTITILRILQDAFLFGAGALLIINIAVEIAERLK